jgi:hypothetical protein
MRTVLTEKFKKKNKDNFVKTRFYFAEVSEGEIKMCSLYKNGETRVFENCIYMGESDEFWFFISDSGCMDFYVVAKNRMRNLFEEGLVGSPSSEYSSEFRGRLLDQIRKHCPFFEEVIYRNYRDVFFHRAESGLQTANRATFETISGVSNDGLISINTEVVEFYREYSNKKMAEKN